MKEEEIKNRKLIVTFRVFQAIFLGIFALGISSISGHVSVAVGVPTSSVSITTTIFGLIGSIITGILANKCKDW